VTVSTNEQAGSKIEWILSIKSTQPDPSGPVTYELVNDGTPADAEFSVTSWEGPDGEKSVTDRKFTFTPPKTGGYTVKAHGRTTKYGSKFTIVQPVN
jgi:hypothetical protein